MTERTTKTQTTTFATLADLQSLRREIHEELAGLRHDLAGFQREITSAFSERQRTNWNTILTGVSVALLIAGMSAALIASIINAESSHRSASDEAAKEIRSLMFGQVRSDIEEDRRTFREFDTVIENTVSVISESIRSEIDSNVRRLDDLINVNKERMEDLSRSLEKIGDEQARRTARVYTGDN